MTDDFIHSIESLAEASDKLLKSFIRRLYSDTPQEDLKSLGAELLYDVAKKSFELFKTRKEHTRKVEITRLDETSEWCVLQVVGCEIPFLIESISNELKLQETEVKLTLYPVICVSRDADGNLTEILDKGTHNELIIHFYIPNWLGYEYYADLLTRINAIIKCVELAVSDWEHMKQKVSSNIKYVQETAFKANIEKNEYIEFLKWTLDKNFIFLGAFISKCTEKDAEFSIVNGSELGICKDAMYKNVPIAFEEHEDQVVLVAKSESRSVVHRTDYMNCICIKKFDANGVNTEKTVFFGFFTSATYYQSVRSIPFIRMKVNNILAKYGHDEANYNSKELVTALEAFPRSDLFQIHEDTLYEMVIGIVSLSLAPRVKAFARSDGSKKFVSFILFIPKKLSSANSVSAIERIIEQQLHGHIARRNIQLSEGQLTRLQFLVKLNSEAGLQYNLQKIEELVTCSISAWQDELFKALCAKYSRNEATIQYQRYKDAFDAKYQASFVAQQAVYDIKMMELSIASQDVKFSFYISAKSGKELAQLKIFSPSELLPLSSTLPIVENMGFLAVDMLSFKTQAKVLLEEQEIYVDYFRLEPKNKNFKEIYKNIKSEIEDAFERIWRGELENDEFNSLITYAKINWRQVSMLRAYAKYFKQIRLIYSTGAIATTLANNATITGKIVQLFNYKFDPAVKDFSDEELKAIQDSIVELLVSVPSITDDKILRLYLNVILATKRTNYFQLNKENERSSYISFKIASEEIDEIPLPKPFREVWVYSPAFEGIHLRGGKVARGGIRWSDRMEDFRTEILGLMKAQMTKNSVIVPVGSKGGFVVKSVTPAVGRDIFFEEGIRCYKKFLCGVLDVTDNIVDDEIVSPSGVVSYEGADPYLVVAADKGTATFSDYANTIAAKYNFWLGDAFASGGSAGYDHKKMAITARGAWISVERHFTELGINIKQQTFSVLGIGDMSGDVFGNGMLLSDKIKLVIAFNHAHIFLDPNPDPEISFKERSRLFGMSRSQWSDYDKSLISSGGGIFSRSEKSIAISDEVRAVLDITDEALSPDELINAALKAPVDLIWNGGIGTYVKATSETHEMIGDKSNDTLRVNGAELRCRVFAEGGNLGCTQLGRIEYARKGGKINTDFIDNSAGVDCSDHEVNIKIGFSKLLQNGTLSLDERNELLIEMTDDVASLVLRDNYKQTQLISLEEFSGSKAMEMQAWLMRYLESQNELDRSLEKLPSNEDLVSLQNKHGKLSRPEIAVLMAYAKTSALKQIAGVNFSSDSHLMQSLIQYFPKLIQERYKDVFLAHKLRNELIHTVLVNDFVNMLGCCFFHQLLSDGGHAAENIIKAFVVVRDSMDVQGVWQKIEEMSNKIPFESQASLFISIQKLIASGIIWVLKHHNVIDDVGKLVESYRETAIKVKELTAKGEISLQCKLNVVDKTNPIYQEVVDNIEELNAASNIFDILHIAEYAKSSIEKAALAYFIVSSKLSIFSIVERVGHASPKHYLDTVALRELVDEISDIKVALIAKYINASKNGTEASEDANLTCCGIFNCAKLRRYEELLSDIGNIADESLISTLVVIKKHLNDLASDSNGGN